MQEQTGYSKTPKTSNIVASKIRIRFPRSIRVTVRDL